MAEKKEPAPVVAAAPTPKEKDKVVRIMWPDNKFVVEGLPVVTREGVRLTAEQYKELEKAAVRSGVRIEEVTE